MAKKTTNRVGRPTVMTNEVIGKLELAYTAGSNNTQACDFADISQDALYDYIKKNPEFSEKIEHWKQRLKLRAKMNIKNAINDGDEDMSKWYLEKTDDGFNPKVRQEVSGSLGFNLVVDDEIEDEETENS